MDNQLISVVIPVYNEAAAITQDLEIINHTLQALGRPFEVIVVNDGSIDESAKLLRSFAGDASAAPPYSVPQLSRGRCRRPPRG